MSDIAQLRTFVLVNELGSLAAAARELGISSAAISKQLTKLETELGLQLLVRSTRNIELTEIGSSYLEQCKRILEQVDEASALVSQMKTTPQGILKVVSGRHFATSFIIPYLKEFLSIYPKIEFDLELAERSPDLKNESIDIVIGMSIPATGDVIQRKIGTTHYSFCASPKYLKEYGKPKNPTDLITHRYITHSMRKPDNELQFKNKTIKIKSYIRVNDSETMLRLAKDGLGIVKLHHYVVQEHLRSGELVEFLSDYMESEIPLYVAFPQRRYIPAKVRCFIDFVLEKMK
ncbi:MAG: LysR family transcriptional regulator [Parachlamydiaceae bacterium]|nr:LysR family transcriptional regulator [Parachlamydiaceae bacterium]